MMTDRSRIGPSRASSVLRSLIFLVAATIVLDYALPQNSGGLRLGLFFLILISGSLLFGANNRLIATIQSLIVVSVVSGAIAIIGVEIVFRVFLLRPAVPVSEEDFTEHIASYWPEPVERESSPGSLRIVGLADSFGRAGEDGNFYYVSSRELARAGHANEVVNLSEWGLELRDELELFRRFGVEFEPDLVVHSFFVGNDFDLPTQELAFFGTMPMRYTPGLRPIRPRWFLHRRWLERCWRVRRDQKAAPDAGFSDAGFLAIERKRLQKWSSQSHLEGVWPQVRQYLEAIRTEALRAGARYAIVIQPDQYQVDKRLRDRLATTSGIDEREVDMTLPQILLTEYCESESIPCLDLLAFLQEKAGEQNLYLLNDTHYNLLGNEVVGREVARFVAEALSDPISTAR